MSKGTSKKRTIFDSIHCFDCPMKTFILAGGFATRLWPLTEKRAKPLLPLTGKPLLSHLVEKVPADSPITVSTNAAFAAGFTEWKKQQKRQDISILIEDTAHDDHKLGALGAVAAWLKQEGSDEDILLLTGDNYCGFAINDFLHRYHSGTALLAAHDIGDTKAAGAFGTVILGSDGKTLEALEEKPQHPRTSLVSTGVSVLPAQVLPLLMDFAKGQPDNVGGIFEELLRKGQKVECFVFRESWFDVGSFEAYMEATKALVGEQLLKEDSATLEKSTCTGSVVLGKNTCITDSKLHNVVVFDDCMIEDCILRDCILDEHCTLRGIDLTGKMLRAGTTLTS